MVTRLLFLVLLCASPAAAHDWYDYSCCYEGDCAELPDGTVKATPSGWWVQETGETVPYADGKFSKDSHFHRCRMIRAEPHSKTRCLYVPGAGS